VRKNVVKILHSPSSSCNATSQRFSEASQLASWILQAGLPTSDTLPGFNPDCLSITSPCQWSRLECRVSLTPHWPHVWACHSEGKIVSQQTMTIFRQLWQEIINVIVCVSFEANLSLYHCGVNLAPSTKLNYIYCLLTGACKMRLENRVEFRVEFRVTWLSTRWNDSG